MSREEIVSRMETICKDIHDEMLNDATDVDVERLTELVRRLAQYRGALNLLEGKDVY